MAQPPGKSNKDPAKRNSVVVKPLFKCCLSEDNYKQNKHNFKQIIDILEYKEKCTAAVKLCYNLASVPVDPG